MSEKLSEKFRRYIRETKEIIGTREYQREMLGQNIKIMRLVSLALALITFLTSTLNIVQQRFPMFITTFIFAIIFTIGFFLGFNEKNGKLMAIGASILIIFIFSYYTLTGGNDGFAILWILLAPMGAMFILGLGYGLRMTTYFQVFLMLFFWTPLKIYVEDYYSSMFLVRFPILYAASAVISFAAITELNKMSLREQMHRAELEQAVKEEREKVSALSLQTILSISNAVDAKDNYTQQHSARVAQYACMIAGKLNWKENEIADLHTIAMLHDIGKIGVSDNLLKKPGSLTAGEYEEMKRHTAIGSEILKDLSFVKNIDKGARFHHERYDGTGYPMQLKGEEIPIEARIIGIADAFDAMNSNRVYREKCDNDYIIEELNKGRMKQFDPNLVDIIIELMNEGQLE